MENLLEKYQAVYCNISTIEIEELLLFFERRRPGSRGAMHYLCRHSDIRRILIFVCPSSSQFVRLCARYIFSVPTVLTVTYLNVTVN